MSQFVAIFVYLYSIMLCLAKAQRPSYAGSRPPDGLTQKDKYYLDSLQNFNNPVNDIQSRFGNSAINNGTPTTTKIAFGIAQRPPIGLPVVVAEPVRSFTFAQPASPLPLSFGIAERAAINNTNNANSNNSFALRIAQNNNDNNNASNENINSFDNQMNGTIINSTAKTFELSSNSDNNNITRLFDAASMSRLPVTSTAISTGTSTVTPQSLPLDALGDRLLVEQLNRLPVEKRPFWFLNYQAIEAQRNVSTPNTVIPQSRPFFAGR